MQNRKLDDKTTGSKSASKADKKASVESPGVKGSLFAVAGTLLNRFLKKDEKKDEKVSREARELLLQVCVCVCVPGTYVCAGVCMCLCVRGSNICVQVCVCVCLCHSNMCGNI